MCGFKISCLVEFKSKRYWMCLKKKSSKSSNLKSRNPRKDIENVRIVDSFPVNQVNNPEYWVHNEVIVSALTYSSSGKIIEAKRRMKFGNITIMINKISPSAPITPNWAFQLLYTGLSGLSTYSMDQKHIYSISWLEKPTNKTPACFYRAGNMKDLRIGLDGWNQQDDNCRTSLSTLVSEHWQNVCSRRGRSKTPEKDAAEY